MDKVLNTKSIDPNKNWKTKVVWPLHQVEHNRAAYERKIQTIYN